MNIQDFSKLIRQNIRTVEHRCLIGEIPAKKIVRKRFGGTVVWEIDDNYIKDLIGEK